MFRGGGEAGGGKKGKNKLEYIKQTPKFLLKMRENIVSEENKHIQAKISMLEKRKQNKQEQEFDLENATIANPEEKHLLIENCKNNNNEIQTNDLEKNFKPSFISKSKKSEKFNKTDDEKKKIDSNLIDIRKKQKESETESFQERKKNEILGKRKALGDYVDKYLKDETSQKVIKNAAINRKKVEKNLLSFVD